jgi:hypothetical protein
MPVENEVKEEVKVEKVTHVTGYEIQKMLKEKGVDRKPQMIYNYIKNELIKSEVVGSQRLVKIEVANEWITKFVAKHKK